MFTRSRALIAGVFGVLAALPAAHGIAGPLNSRLVMEPHLIPQTSWGGRHGGFKGRNKRMYFQDPNRTKVKAARAERRKNAQRARGMKV